MERHDANASNLMLGVAVPSNARLGQLDRYSTMCCAAGKDVNLGLICDRVWVNSSELPLLPSHMMTSLYGFAKRIYLVCPFLCLSLRHQRANIIQPRTRQFFNPPLPESPTESPLRFGILGAAAIAPFALVFPVKSHPDAIVKAIAARDQGRADTFAKKHSIPKAYGGPGAYQSTCVMYYINRCYLVNHQTKDYWTTRRSTSCITPCVT